MNPQLEVLANQVTHARKASELFGSLPAADRQAHNALRKNYHALVRLAHPDLYTEPAERAQAESILEQLITWYRIAAQQLQDGTYASAKETTGNITIRTARHVYQVENSFVQDEIFNLYPCTVEENHISKKATLRLVRDPQDNRLAENEFIALGRLAQTARAAQFAAYLPALVENFIYSAGGEDYQAGVFESTRGWHSLEEVRARYPRGIDPRDMAWMWRRLLTILGQAHRNGIIHAGVTPANVLILPGEHGLMLTNWWLADSEPSEVWEFAQRANPVYAGWYPESRLLTPGCDVAMSARCMLTLLGADPSNPRVPDELPEPLQNFFRGSILPGKKAPQDAWALLQDLDECLSRLWGKRKLHPFKM